MRERAIALALLKRATKITIAHLLFFKERMSDRSLNCSFSKSDKRAIAHLLFFKEQMSDRLLNRSFEKSDEKSDRSFAPF
ncbi:MAG: hypothetical protein FJ333_03365 [Sphingomonadales bacterium]|nr:hypothetical protein [Sphingomonadales bacterium]